LEIPEFIDDDIRPPLQGISMDELPPDGKTLSALAQLGPDEDDDDD